MTSFHRTIYPSYAKDHPGQKQVKEFARCIEWQYNNNNTRYLRERFRCGTCYKIGRQPKKANVKKETTCCDNCFEKNTSGYKLDLCINLPINFTTMKF